MAFEVGIAVLSTVVFAAVLFSFLNWLKDLIKNSGVLGLEKGVEERRPDIPNVLAEVDLPQAQADDSANVLREKAATILESFAGVESNYSIQSVNRKTTSLIDEFEGFYGRDADKKAIRDLLISEDDNGSNPGVIPIVGMGGVGKTTLAQHVCNDKAVQERFKILAWVCVANQFDVTKVTEEIVKKVTGTAGPCDKLDQLQHELKDALDGKKFLLVLDDVWSVDYEKWRQLLTPLRSGAKGSKIIVITRSKDVAPNVQAVTTYNLRQLEDEACWKLFARHACLDVNSTANREEIVRKCGGLPLAAKALGGVLRCQTEAEKWTEVLKSKIWEIQNARILPALAMSYIHLPSHLKRCFAYCAIFPQDWVFKKEELVALWMSEGILVQRKGNQSLEEIGDRYFDDLVSRSFFQHSSDFRGKPYFVMHDLMHDLARFVSEECCSRLEGGISRKIGKKTRHLSCGRNVQSFPNQFIQDTLLLRSFVLADKQNHYSGTEKLITYINEEVGGLLSTRKVLRLLSMSYLNITELPNSIGNLKHMRHLDLSGTSIERLPEAVTSLFHLEILILRHCEELVELPADMARLINLCQLDLSGTFKLKGMPPEMGKLKKLSKLSDFVVGENGGSSIKELGHLHYLRGEISIWRLQNVKNYRDASEANLEDKENLKMLKLRWDGDGDDSRQVKQVLERLRPHMHIESIEIWGYRGTQFPNWVGDFSFSKLKQLHLKGCKKCVCLPPLGQLASLEELSIHGGYDGVLEDIGVEFYGMCKPEESPFSSLKRLEFRSMLNWRKWSSFEGAFPVLEELKLHNCHKLMSVPDQLPSLKRLRIENCGELDIENLLNSAWATLESIDIWSNEKSGIVKLGPWSAQGNENWDFQLADGAGLKQIIVNSGALVDAITFTVDDGTGRTSKMKFGGDGGTAHTINLDPSKERILGITGAHGYYFNGHYLSSITFLTNLNTYGPYGAVKEGDQGVTNISSFSSPMQDGAVVGFHGRARQYIDAIGVYVKPTDSALL